MSVVKKASKKFTLVYNKNVYGGLAFGMKAMTTVDVAV